METIAKRRKIEKVDDEKKVERGKGVDIGTAFVKGALKMGDEVVFKRQRNAFFEVEHTDFTKGILDEAKVKYLIKDNKLYIVGDEAFNFANIFNRETRRPLSKGVISPQEKEALPMIELLIKGIVGKPSYQGEVIYFSIPGEPQDANFSIIYHEKVLNGFLRKLGYTAKTINEGHAVVLSELTNEDFTGIGISFGGGMVNVCLSFMSVPVFKFSVAKAGDWIDQQVSMAVDESVSRVSAIKETSLDLTKEDNLTKIEGALSIYYNHLIEYVIQNIKQQFSQTKKLPLMQKPIVIVLSGGTSLPKGFGERFKRILNQVKLPISVGEVRMAVQPLRSVAKGALIAAITDESKSR